MGLTHVQVSSGWGDGIAGEILAQIDIAIAGGRVMTASNNFEPKIIGFVCNWCSYAGADLAGARKMQYPPNITLIRVMCSGRIDPAFVLTAFKDGADGVLITGCHLPTDCHYINGNFKAKKRMTLLKKVLQEFGIEAKRVRVEWISATEGDKFAAVVNDMVKEIKELGPNPFTIKEVKP